LLSGCWPGHGPSSTGAKKAKFARFVKVRGDDRRIDEAGFARAQTLVGLKGYVTNVPMTMMPAAEVIAKYHDPWTRRSRAKALTAALNFSLSSMKGQ
jgi:hypothetical protein